MNVVRVEETAVASAC